MTSGSNVLIFSASQTFKKGATVQAQNGQLFTISEGSSTTWLAFQAATATASGDRKSTRLNSSHVRISYAVFCLKKKNKYLARGDPLVGHACLCVHAVTGDPNAPWPLPARRLLAEITHVALQRAD